MALYPPIVASSMPAFNYGDDEVKIYFTISGYNNISIDDIQAVQVSVRYQSNNLSALNDPKQFISKENIQLDQNVNKYYIVLNKSDLNGGFKKDYIYKVQLRFKGPEWEKDSYTTNINNASQWSTVCIIKPISPPLIYIQDFDQERTGQDSDVTDENNFFNTFADFVATYQVKDSSEVLSKWRVRLLKSSFEKKDLNNIASYTLADTGYKTVSANNYNLNSNNLILECSIPYELKANQNQYDTGPHYKLYLEILTKNDYSHGVLYNFTYNPLEVSSIQGGVLTTSVNEQEGYIKLHFESDDETSMTNLVIRRADSKSNFTNWEDLKNFEVLENINFDYYDFTVESGVLYRYLVQKRDSRGRRGTPIYDYNPKSEKGTMVEWEHAFLLESTGNGILANGVEQLKLKYDFQISSYKTNISESRTDTIGSKYPYIRRNGNMYYRSFPITGTITAYMDEAELFVTKEELYKGRQKLYKQYRGQYTRDNQAKGQITWFSNVYDYTKERLFREKVEAFLYNSKPKLYKSMQQGNIFIKLMEVSLTPKNELGRLIYTFSATAYQIDQACIDTYNRYNLINVGNYNPSLYTPKTTMSQVTSYSFNNSEGKTVFPGGYDIIGSSIDKNNPSPTNIANSLKYRTSFNQNIVSDFKIDWIRLIIDSEPYLIMEKTIIKENGQQQVTYAPVDDIYNPNDQVEDSQEVDEINKPINYPLYQIESTYNNQNIYLGWLFTINGKQIIVAHPNNIYQINEKDFLLTTDASIIPAKDTIMSVDYRANLKIVEDTSLIPKAIRFDNINAQLVGPFDPDMDLINKIRAKYRYSYEDETSTIGDRKVKKFLNGVQTVLVDTQPNAVIYLKTSVDNNESRFVVNETGELKFDPHKTQVNIRSLRVAGINIPMPASTYDNRNNPANGKVCIEDGNIYCYIGQTWYPCDSVTENGITSLDIKYPIDALVFYYATIRREYY